MQPTRICTLPAPAADVPPLVALTATARGMVDGSLARAARLAFGELMPAVDRAGQMDQVRSVIGLVPDVPAGPDDPACRYIAGVLLGHDLATGTGPCARPALALTGSLAWWTLSPGRWAVFIHRGPYDGLRQSWTQVRRGWLTGSGERLRPTPPMERVCNDPGLTPPDDLVTELWLPLA